MVLLALSTLLTIAVLFLGLFLPISCLDFIYNTFNSSSLLLYGNATIKSSVLTLTNSELNMSRAFYPQPILTRPPNSSHLLPFSTSFVFSTSSPPEYFFGRGFAFLFTPFPGAIVEREHLGFNSGRLISHFFGIKFDLFMTYEASNSNRVGLLVNSLTPRTAHEAGYWIDGEDAEFQKLQLHNGENYQVWIDYMNSQINVTFARAGMKRPNRPLITDSINLSEAFLDQVYVGFSSPFDRVIESQRILSWSFSNSNFSIADALITKNLPSFFVSKEDQESYAKGVIIGISISGLLVIMCGYVTYEFLIRRRRNKRKLEETEDWETEYWPHRIEYQEIYNATKGLAEQNVIGNGANGKVYGGVLQGGVAVAIKRISLETAHGMREFLAEISTLGRLKHRNLVGLRGWCKSHKRGLMLVYDYMDSGSLDKWLFRREEKVLLDWQQRIKILKDVASVILYLHEGWEARVLHRDIKASNVLLDKDMNARLGDFGLARMDRNGQQGETTRVIGTVGYMAPELVHNGRASAQTDVYSFGILILEVVSGRRRIEEGKQGLTDWVNELMQKGKFLDALDKRLIQNGVQSEEDEVEKVLHLGLSCANPEPNARPSMRQILKALEKTNEKLTPEINSSDNNMISNGIEKDQLSLCMSLSTSDIILEGR